MNDWVSVIIPEVMKIQTTKTVKLNKKKEKRKKRYADLATVEGWTDVNALWSFFLIQNILYP